MLLKSITHDECDGPTVTFPVAERHRPLTDSKLYSLVTWAQRCEQLAAVLGFDSKLESNPRPLDRKSDTQAVAPPRNLLVDWTMFP